MHAHVLTCFSDCWVVELAHTLGHVGSSCIDHRRQLTDQHVFRLSFVCMILREGTKAVGGWESAVGREGRAESLQS